jgi:hypothetical protein
VATLARRQAAFVIVLGDQRLGGIVALKDLLGQDWRVAAPAGAPVTDLGGIAATHDGRFVLADRAAGVLVVMDADGGNPAVLDPAGSPIGPLRNPSGLCQAPDGGLLIADTGNHRVVRLSAMAGGEWTSYGSAGAAQPGEFASPTSIVVSSTGSIVVADPGAGRLVRFDDLSGTGWAVVPLPAGSSRPYGLTAASDHVLATDVSGSAVLRLDPDGSCAILFARVGELSAPVAAVRDAASIVVAEAGRAQLSRWEQAGGTWQRTERLAGTRKALPGPEFTRVIGMVTA